jgi:hypothetical protein
VHTVPWQSRLDREASKWRAKMAVYIYQAGKVVKGFRIFAVDRVPRSW